MKNSFIKKLITQDISKIYDILKIENEYVLNTNHEKIYIYEIFPILDLNKEKIKNVIINNYAEFLRLQNEIFQIYVDLKKINLNNYFKDLYNLKKEGKNNKKEMLFNNYISQIENYNNKNTIILKKFYVIIKTENIKEFEKSLNLLNIIGCKFKRIKGKENLEIFLYSKINKEEL